jgi:tetratricopeptide (TPR) repeat protein
MQVGEVLAQRYAIESRAASGGMATVFRARDRKSGAPVAVKVLRAFDAGIIERFAREAVLLSQLDHPAIVRYVDHGVTAAGEHFLAMEWLEGVDLSKRLAALPLDVAETLALVRRVGEALAAAHSRGVVHRDIKPSNLFLVNGRVDQVKVLDFGVAHILSDTDVTRTGARIGTPAFMAPEQVRGERIDARTDVFALGGVIFASLTGRHPYEGADEVAVYLKTLLDEPPSISVFRTGVPLALERFISVLMAKDPANRPADGAAVLAHLDTLGPDGEGDGLLPEHPTLTEREQRLMSVVVVGRKPHMSDLPTAVLDGAPNVLDGPTIATPNLVDIVRTYGASIERLADGSHVIALIAEAGLPAIDLAAKAARCALAVREVSPDAPVVLATGRGAIAKQRLVGQVVDRAAKLLRDGIRGLRRDDQAVLIDDVAAGLLDSRFVVTGSDSALWLTAERGETAVQRTLLGKPTPCVGRDRELATLEAIVAEAAEESVARVVLITAIPGMGKSRLRGEFLRRLERRDNPIEVWLCRADAMTTGAPLGMLGRVLRRMAGILDGEPPGVRQQKLSARVARHVPADQVQRVAEFLGELADVPFTEAKSVQLRSARRDPVLLGDQMLRAWIDFLSAECAARPLLLVFEDLHWGDQATVKFVDAALRALRDRPLVVLALARPTIHETLPQLWQNRGVIEIHLAELSPKASERLVRAVLPSADPATVARLVELAAGNAFYLEELIRTAADGQTKLPETVLAMVEGRLEALTPEARRVLRAASIFGEVFWRSGVLALCADMGLTDVNRVLVELVGLELIGRRADRRFVGEEEYVFRHALLREAAFATLTENDRTLGHRLAAEWLEKTNEKALTLAEHFERGGEARRAATYYKRAAEQALTSNDFDGVLRTAEASLRLGADADERGDVELMIAEAHTWRGRLADGDDWASRALISLPEGSANWWRAAGEAAFARGSLARYDSLTGLLARMREVPADAEGIRARVIALARTTAVLFAAGRYQLAEQMLAQIDPDADALIGDGDREPAVAGPVYWARGWQATYRRDIAKALHYRAAGAEAYERAGDLRSACQQRAMQGSVLNKVGRFSDAVTVLRPAIVLASAMALDSVLGLLNNNLGFALCSLGKLDEGLEIETNAVRTFQAAGNLRLEAASRGYLARFLVGAGRIDEATEEAETACSLAKTTPPMHALALAMLARARLADGRPTEALAAAREACAILESLGGIDEGESLLLMTLAEALRANGDNAGAEASLREARQRLLARADLITNPQLRKSFLENVADNARTMKLAQDWGI